MAKTSSVSLLVGSIVVVRAFVRAGVSPTFAGVEELAQIVACFVPSGSSSPNRASARIICARSEMLLSLL